MRRIASFVILVLLGVSAIDGAEVKIAGAQLLPKDLLFTTLEASRAEGEGNLSGGCKWSLKTETSIAEQRAERCSDYYYRTFVTLVRSCPAPAKPITQVSHRTAVAGTGCPDKPFQTKSEAKLVSMGTNADGKEHVIFVQPDGTRITLLSGEEAVTVTIRYLDGSSDGFKTP